MNEMKKNEVTFSPKISNKSRKING